MGPQSLFTKCVAASVITLIDSFNVLKSPVIILIVCGRDNDNGSMAYIVIAVYHMAFSTKKSSHTKTQTVRIQLFSLYSGTPDKINTLYV